VTVLATGGEGIGNRGFHFRCPKVVVVVKHDQSDTTKCQNEPDRDPAVLFEAGLHENHGGGKQNRTNKEQNNNH
jgi:hypothetical protein